MKSLLIAVFVLIMSACVVEEQGQPVGEDEITEGGGADTAKGFPTSQKDGGEREFLNCRWRVECRYNFENRYEECCDRCYSDSGQLLATGACTLRVVPPRSNL